MIDPAPRFARAHAQLRTAAVTGTNGKTTTTTMIAAIVRASGEPTARLTTLGAWVDDELVVAPTLADEFLATVETAVARAVRTLALEVTSKALVYGLARRWPPHVAVFTNLSRDHIEAHGSPEAYLAAKAQLFRALPPGGVAVWNGDDPASALLDEVTPAHVVRRRFSAAGGPADLAAAHVDAHVAGTRIRLVPSPLADALGGTLALRAIGAVHAANALAAALAADALGYAPSAIARGLEAFQSVEGRFEIVARAPLVVVDYAHTPDGLRGTLATARGLVAPGGRLVCVFGCGGGRDRAKRPEMGAIAARDADAVVVTTDNPRFESPSAIAEEIRAGMPVGANVRIELDRRAAIGLAIHEAGPADVVVIAGKGHEKTMEIGGEQRLFSDVDEARAAMGARRTASESR